MQNLFQPIGGAEIMNRPKQQNQFAQINVAKNVGFGFHNERDIFLLKNFADRFGVAIIAENDRQTIGGQAAF